MALYKDGKVYRTLEQQVGHLTEEHDAQVEINEELENSISDLEATVAVLPDKTYVDNADNALQTQIDGKVSKTYVDNALLDKVDKITGTSTRDKAYIKTTSGSQSSIDITTSAIADVLVKRDASGNIQSNTPVNSTDVATKGYVTTELTDKLDKITTSTSNPQLYAKKIDGTQQMVNYGDTLGNSMIVQRTATGTIKAADPTENTDVATKKYVDDNAGGGTAEVIQISGNSGSFSSSDFNKLLNDNCLIFHTANTRFYYKITNSANYLTYGSINRTTDYITHDIISIRKSTRAWNLLSTTVYVKPEGTSVASTGITSGKVLTANGSGGCTWEDAGGGGGSSSLYKHTMTFVASSGDMQGATITLIMISSDNTPVTTGLGLANALMSGNVISSYLQHIKLDAAGIDMNWYGMLYYCQGTDNIPRYLINENAYPQQVANTDVITDTVTSL